MIRIAHNAHTAKLLDASKEAKLEVHRLLSYRVEGAEHMAAFKTGTWSGRSSFFNFDGGTFPAGFIHLVSAGLRKAGYTIQMVAAPRPEPLGPERPKVDDFGDHPRYDYQPQTIDKLVRHGQIIAQVATGGGKSRIARMAYKRIDRPTLFLTTRGILMHQMRRAVEKMDGHPVAVLGDGEWGVPYTKPDGTKGRRLTKFAVGMVQTLSQRLEKKDVDFELLALKERRLAAAEKKIEALKAKLRKAGVKGEEIGKAVIKLADEIEASYPSREQDLADIEAKVAHHEKMRLATIDILSRFEFVIAEEAHEISGTGFYDVMRACKNAHYRLALTATPFMKDDEEANMRLLASCGPVAIRITEKMLIDRGILARPFFKFVRLNAALKPPKLFQSTPWQRAYEIGIVENEHRNKLLCAEVLRALRYGLNAMMLVQHTKHGDILLEMLRRAGVRAEFIRGENDQASRDAALGQLGSGAIDVLIGTNILDVGVDVPSVGVIVLAGGGKAEVATRQRIGRGLREKKNGLPNVALIVDVEDGFNLHLRGHAQQRRAIIEGTPGFVEGIVPVDFDFAALGLTRKAA